MRYFIILAAFLMSSCHIGTDDLLVKAKDDCKNKDSCTLRLRLERFACKMLEDTRSEKIRWENLDEDTFYRYEDKGSLFSHPNNLNIHIKADKNVIHIINECAKDLFNFLKDKQLPKKSDKAIEDFLDSIR